MSKARLLIFPFDLLSHYLRCIQLAERFADYDVYFADSDRYNAFVLKKGYSTFKAEKFDAGMVMQQAEKFSFAWLNEEDIERVFLSQVNVIKELKPALIISDNSPTVKMAAEYTNVKCIALTNAYMSRYYDGFRAVSRTHYSYAHVQKLPPRLGRFITRVAEKAAFHSIHKPFKTLRKKYGLKHVQSYLHELEGDHNLICDNIEIFPLRSLPSNFEVIGPLNFEQEENEDELIRNIDPAKALICVCLGSTGNWTKLRFLTDQKFSAFNIIAAGDLKKELEAPHIFHKDFVNLDKILPLCSLLVCHGGNGTIYKGLKWKKKMLFLTNHFEQEWNAGRLEELGLGLIINDMQEERLLKELALMADSS